LTEDAEITEGILTGQTADVYFVRTQEILRREGLNPVVTAEVFGGRAGVLCGLREVLTLLRRVLPRDARVEALREGDHIAAREVVLRITAHYDDFGLYETAVLGTLAHETGWATGAAEVVAAAQGIPVMSFGARHVHPDISARMDYAAIIGGCVGCSTTAGAVLTGTEPSGTIPHALVLIFGDTLAATEAFDRIIDPKVGRVALVDTFHDEAEESVRVATAMGARLWGVRLDTPSERGRVTPELVREVRARLDQAGCAHVKIAVSGGLDADRIRLLLENKAPVDAFGVGSSISGAHPIDFTMDIKAIEGRPIAKRGRIPGPTDNPRLHPVDLR
jgi:nicotinate phosphoribosyltransferase